MATQYAGKASVDEYTMLKDRVIALRGELLVANSRVKELEPDVKQVIMNMHAEEGGNTNSETFPVLLFADKRKVIELKRRRRTPTLTVKVLVRALNAFLSTQTLTLGNVTDFVAYLKTEREGTRTQSEVVRYRPARLCELGITEGDAIIASNDTLAVPLVESEPADDLGAVPL